MTISKHLQQIERTQPLDDLAYLRIKEAILTGVFLPGKPLVSNQIATDLHISRTPIRQALTRLEREGFAISEPFRGYYVSRIDSREIQAMYELREVLECHLIRATVGRFTPEELDELDAVIEAAGAALKRGDHACFQEKNRVFHHTFDIKFGNPRISEVLRNLDERVHWVLSLALQLDRLNLEHSYKEHVQILQAVRDGNAECASELLQIHLRRASATLAQMLDSRADT